MLVRLGCLALVFASFTPAAVTGVHIAERTLVNEGKEYGSVGPYERIRGRIDFAIDPLTAANRIIHDAALAPRNAAGKVEFSADFYILQPRDATKGNGTLLFEVSNRGGKGMIMHFNLAMASRTPGTAPGDLGDGYLMEQGYTLAWVGWQVDTPEGGDTLHLYAPVAKNTDGSAIMGKVRSDFVLDQASRFTSLADMGHQPYRVADPLDATAVLTVRDRIDDRRRIIPRSEWSFAREENGRAVPDAGAIYLAASLVPGKIYEVIYTAQDPPVIGFGPTAVRDFISFLKFGGQDNPAHNIQRSLGYGISQSARFLRDFLYEGFNADERDRQVFDGVWAHVGGAGRGNFNYRFAQASRDSRPFLNFFYPVDIFPFTDLPEDDAGKSEGLLDRARAAHKVPKIFYSNGSYEYWGRAAALIHSSPDGHADFQPAPNTRIFFIAGAQHTPGHVPPTRLFTADLSNPEDYRFALRALLADMQAWLKEGTAPPASRYPSLAKGELTPVAELHFPHIPGIHPPQTFHRAYHVDYGSDYRIKGVLTEPPSVGAAFPLLVPQVDADGIDMGGIRLPEVAVPLGTYTGWNFRTAAMGAPNEMASFIGSFFPFAKTKAQRVAAHDPRLSVEERYATEQDYQQRLQKAAADLVSERLMLERDIPRVVERAHQEWTMSPAP
jgi:hypothetical protein